MEVKKCSLTPPFTSIVFNIVMEVSSECESNVNGYIHIYQCFCLLGIARAYNTWQSFTKLSGAHNIEKKIQGYNIENYTCWVWLA